MRETLSRGALCFLLAAVIGCGTIFYPERRGQHPVGKVDVGVVVMNALWLLVGLVPGIVAFAVDLSTGALYHPPGGSSDLQRKDVQHAVVPPGQALVFGARGPERSQAPWTVALLAEGAAAPIQTWMWTGAGEFSLELPHDLEPGRYEMAFREGDSRIGGFALAVGE